MHLLENFHHQSVLTDWPHARRQSIWLAFAPQILVPAWLTNVAEDVGYAVCPVPMPLVALPLPTVLLGTIGRLPSAPYTLSSLPLTLKDRAIRQDMPAPAYTLRQSLWQALFFWLS